jgi:3-oxoacyl-(acyl-carrier-protein) synthase
VGDLASIILLSSTKNITGHLLGAADDIEVIADITVIQTGKIPSMINDEFPYPECDIFYVPNKAISKVIDVVISENSGFCGFNMSLLFKKLSD